MEVTPVPLGASAEASHFQEQRRGDQASHLQGCSFRACSVRGRREAAPRASASSGLEQTVP